MNSLTTTRGLLTVVAAAALLLVGALPSSAQQDDTRLGVTLRGSMLWVSGGGDVLRTATRELTLERSDLDTTLGALELTARPPLFEQRVDLLLGVELGGSEANSTTSETAFSGAPVAQRTEFDPGPAAYLGGRLRMLPPEGRRFNGVLTGALGLAQYEFRQVGTFRDHRDGHAFEAEFQTDGTYGFAMLGAGVEIAVGSGLSVLADYRVRAGSASPEGDFEGFRKLDLGGTQFSIGLTRMF